MRASFFGLADPSEPLDARVALVSALQLLGLGAARHHPQTHSFRQPRHGFEQHREALARLVPTDVRDRGCGAALGGDFVEAIQLDTVEDQLVVAANAITGHLGGIGRDRGPNIDPRRQPPCSRHQVRKAAPRCMPRADGGR